MRQGNVSGRHGALRASEGKEGMGLRGEGGGPKHRALRKTWGITGGFRAQNVRVLCVVHEAISSCPTGMVWGDEGEADRPEKREIMVTWLS